MVLLLCDFMVQYCAENTGVYAVIYRMKKLFSSVNLLIFTERQSSNLFLKNRLSKIAAHLEASLLFSDSRMASYLMKNFDKVNNTIQVIAVST